MSGYPHGLETPTYGEALERIAELEEALRKALADTADALPMTSDGQLYQHAIVFGTREEAEAAQEKLKATADAPPEVTEEMVDKVSRLLWLHRPRLDSVIQGWDQLPVWKQREVNAGARDFLAALGAARKEGRDGQDH